MACTQKKSPACAGLSGSNLLNQGLLDVGNGQAAWGFSLV